jgi:hypothetical protein
MGATFPSARRRTHRDRVAGRQRAHFVRTRGDGSISGTGNVAAHDAPRHDDRLMAGRFAIGMVLLDRGPAADAAHKRLVEVLPGCESSPPDEVGVFEVTLDADSQDDALRKVWDAVAAAGADDHVAFLEHPALPEHWRHLAKAPA